MSLLDTSLSIARGLYEGKPGTQGLELRSREWQRADPVQSYINTVHQASQIDQYHLLGFTGIHELLEITRDYKLCRALT